MAVDRAVLLKRRSIVSSPPYALVIDGLGLGAEDANDVVHRRSHENRRRRVGVAIFPLGHGTDDLVGYREEGIVALDGFGKCLR